MVRAISSASSSTLIGSKKPVLVKFCAAWCGSCRRFVPAFDALATQYPGVEFVTVDVDGVQEVFNAQFAGCSRVSLPSFKHFKAGSEVGNFVSGANEAEIRKLLGGSGSGSGADLTPGDSARYFSGAHTGMYLGGYARYGARAYPTLEAAMKACLEDASAGGVTQEGRASSRSEHPTERLSVGRGLLAQDGHHRNQRRHRGHRRRRRRCRRQPPPVAPPVAPPASAAETAAGTAPKRGGGAAEAGAGTVPKPPPACRLLPRRAGACTAASAGACTAAGAVAQGEPLGALSCALLLLLPVQEGRRADEGRCWRAGSGCVRLRRRAVRAGAAAGAAGAARAVKFT